MAYNINAEDGWELLGMLKYEGPEPDLMMIQHRSGLLQDLLLKAGSAALEPE